MIDIQCEHSYRSGDEQLIAQWSLVIPFQLTKKHSLFDELKIGVNVGF